MTEAVVLGKAFGGDDGVSNSGVGESSFQWWL